MLSESLLSSLAEQDKMLGGPLRALEGDVVSNSIKARNIQAIINLFSYHIRIFAFTIDIPDALQTDQLGGWVVKDREIGIRYQEIVSNYE